MKRYVIRPGELGSFDLYLDGEVVRTDTDCKALSTWAFINGAESVCWDFDLTIVETR